ncbi:MAG: GYD domain-containing protein [Hasllibacter sp.]
MIYVTTGRYTGGAINALMENPEDRTGEVRKLVEQAGGKLREYYFTFGDHDFIVISEGDVPPERYAASLIGAAAAGSVQDLRTHVAMTGAAMKKAFTEARKVAKSFRPAGTPERKPQPAQ